MEKIMIYEKIDELCKKNGTNITTLCKEITNSGGNLSTWKKDNIKPMWLIPICKKFKVSSDYLLGLEFENTSIVDHPQIELSANEMVILSFFRELNSDYQDIVLAELKKFIKMQEYEKNIKQENAKKEA